MTRTASYLAALASAAIPGLDPTSAQLVRARPGALFDAAYVVDSQERRWLVQAPRTPVAGALLEDVVELSTLLAHRLDIAIPTIRGQVEVPEGRAVVQPLLAGRPLDFARLPEGLGLAADVGRALAHVHNLEVALFEEAGRPSYDAEATRTRLLTDLDRGAATGHVPTSLLARWEHSLEDVSLWRFLPTPVHGNFTGSHVLATFDDEDDAGQGRVAALLGWEESHVGDPSEDFAELAAVAPPAALRSVVDAYGPSRIDRPDRHLLARARLASEMALVRRLLAAVAADDSELVEEAAHALRALDERTAAEHDLVLQPADRDGWVARTEGRAQAGPPGEPSGSLQPPIGSGDEQAEAREVSDVAGRSDADRSSVDPTASPASASPAAHFEIDDAEPLDDGERFGDAEPLDDGGLLDLHEGASEFIPVTVRQREDEQPPAPG